MWNQIALDVPDDLKDAVTGEASDSGAAGVWEDAGRLVLYFTAGASLDDIEGRIRAIFERSGVPHPGMTRSVVEDCDWTEEWKKSYSSFPVGTGFYVIPSWIDSRCPDDRLPIRIDPGQAFGTGTHETTQLTMELLERWVAPDQRVLDVGTGSGILALAARMLGAKRVFACDVDPVAVQVAGANILRNDEPEVWTFCGSVDAVAQASIHLLLGNLTADVIVYLLPEFHRILGPQGLAIISGILNEQREDVLAACHHQGFVVHEEIVRGEWLALAIEKHGA